MKKTKYHRSNCDTTVRAVIIDALGRKITLVGRHAFEWSIILETDNRIIMTTFPNRKQAVTEFNRKYRGKFGR